MPIYSNDIPKPRPPKIIPLESKVPKELKPVKEEKPPERVELNFSDDWNIFWGKVTQGYNDIMTVVRSANSLKWIIGGLIVLVILIFFLGCSSSSVPLQKDEPVTVKSELKQFQTRDGKIIVIDGGWNKLVKKRELKKGLDCLKERKK